MRTLAFIFLIIPFLTIAQEKKTPLEDQIDAAFIVHYQNLDSALHLIDELLIQVEKNEDQRLIAKANSYKAVFLDIKGQADIAIPLFLDAIKTQKDIEDSVGLGFSYNNLGLLYYYQYDYESAVNFLRESLQIRTALKDTAEMIGGYTNLAVSFQYLDSLDKTIDYADRALMLAQKINDTLGMVAPRHVKASILFVKREYEAALKIYLEEETFINNNPGELDLITNQNCIALSYGKLGDFERAEAYGLSALNLSISKGDKDREMYVYETLQEISFDQKQYEKGYNYLLKYSKLRDTLLNEDRTNSINEIQAKYDVLEKDAELAMQKTEIAKKNEAIAEKDKWRNALIMGIALALVTVIFIWFAYRSKKKMTHLLEEKNKSISQNLKQKETMMGEIHHRVKNNLQLISSILHLKSKSLKNNAAKEALVESQQKVGAMMQLHKYLYQQDTLEKVNLGQYIESMVADLSHVFKRQEQEIFYDLELEKDVQISVDQAVSIGIILSELINNMYKHAFVQEDGEFEVKLKKKEEQRIALEVQDSGNGSKLTKKELIRQSFGLEMVDAMINQLGGFWKINGMHYTIEMEINGQ